MTAPLFLLCAVTAVLLCGVVLLVLEDWKAGR